MLWEMRERTENLDPSRQITEFYHKPIKHHKHQKIRSTAQKQRGDYSREKRTVLFRMATQLTTSTTSVPPVVGRMHNHAEEQVNIAVTRTTPEKQARLEFFSFASEVFNTVATTITGNQSSSTSSSTTILALQNANPQPATADNTNVSVDHNKRAPPSPSPSPSQESFKIVPKSPKRGEPDQDEIDTLSPTPPTPTCSNSNSRSSNSHVRERREEAYLSRGLSGGNKNHLPSPVDVPPFLEEENDNEEDEEGWEGEYDIDDVSARHLFARAVDRDETDPKSPNPPGGANRKRIQLIQQQQLLQQVGSRYLPTLPSLLTSSPPGKTQNDNDDNEQGGNMTSAPSQPPESSRRVRTSPPFSSPLSSLKTLIPIVPPAQPSIHMFGSQQENTDERNDTNQDHRGTVEVLLNDNTSRNGATRPSSSSSSSMNESPSHGSRTTSRSGSNSSRSWWGIGSASRGSSASLSSAWYNLNRPSSSSRSRGHYEDDENHDEEESEDPPPPVENIIIISSPQHSSSSTKPSSSSHRPDDDTLRTKSKTNTTTFNNRRRDGLTMKRPRQPKTKKESNLGLAELPMERQESTEHTMTDGSSSHFGSFTVGRGIPMDILILSQGQGSRQYSLPVDVHQQDKATELKLFNFSRPHMRAFHFAWWSIFVSYASWFAITPLLSEVRESLGLTRQDIWTSTILSIPLVTVLQTPIRFLSAKYGPRRLVWTMLSTASIPMLCMGGVQSVTELSILRFLSGIFGVILVVTQSWTDQMFDQLIAEAVRARVGGWVETGATQLIMGSILFPLFKNQVYNGDANKAWRAILVFPPLVAFATGVAVHFTSDDTPQGSFKEVQQQGETNTEPPTTTATFVSSNRQVTITFNTGILFLQHACTFGTYLTITNAAPMYFYDEFGLSTESAAATASVYGWMGFFGPWMGRYMSDWAHQKSGLQGRLLNHTILLVGQGVACILFPMATSLVGAVAILSLLSIFQHAALASSLAIVPYVDPAHTESIRNIVSSGGGIGAVAFCLGFRQLSYTLAFRVMGVTALPAAVLSVYMNVRGQARLFGGEGGTSIIANLDRRETESVDISIRMEAGAPAVVSSSVAHDDIPPSRAMIVDFAGTVSTCDMQQQPEGLQFGGYLSKRCTKNHSCYEVGVVYGAIKCSDHICLEPSFVGCRCRECQVEIATRWESSKGVIATVEAPVYMCLECKLKFVCSNCWRDTSPLHRSASM